MATLLQNFKADSLAATYEVGQTIYSLLEWPAVVYLQGDLGAGKTTLCQAIIAAAGYSGTVTSPTYNLIHEYPVVRENSRRADDQWTIFHLDLYRLEDPQELYYLGLADLIAENTLFLIEWPEKGGAALQPPDYVVDIAKVLKNDSAERTIRLLQAN